MSEKTELPKPASHSTQNYISVKEAAAISSYDTAYVTRLAQKGRIKAIKDGRQWLIDANSLRDFVREINSRKEARKNQLREERLREISIDKSVEEDTYKVFDLRAATQSVALAMCV